MASFPWDKFKTLAGGILVTIGVAGELFVSYEASRVENQLRENSHRIEGLSIEKAANAERDAEIAKEQTEKERLARVELEKSIQWRTLSREQKEAMCASLSPGFMPSPAFQNGDIEAYQYAIQFAEVLRGCQNGRLVKEDKNAKPSVEGIGSYPVPVDGVWLGTANADRKSLASINRLLRGLRDSGVKVEGLDSTRFAGEILVGHMPLPPVEALQKNGTIDNNTTESSPTANK